MVTPPGAHPGMPARQAHPTRRPRGTQNPHGCQLPLYNPGQTLLIQGSLRTRPEGGRHTHTHTLLLLGTSRYYQFPVTTTGGPPKQTTASLWEPPRDSPVPPQGATNRRPATEVDYATQPLSLPGGGPAAGNPRLGPTPECPRARHIPRGDLASPIEVPQN